MCGPEKSDPNLTPDDLNLYLSFPFIDSPGEGAQLGRQEHKLWNQKDLRLLEPSVHKIMFAFLEPRALNSVDRM